MTKKSKVYTKSGDGGETSLVGGQRVSKSNLRIDLYGDVDELNSHLGVVSSHLAMDNLLKDKLLFVEQIQSKLFDLGSNLASEVSDREKFKLPQISEEFLKQMESEIDEMDALCEPLKSFVLPGGAVAATHLHVCRTVCRRVERKLIRFAGEYGTEEKPQLSAEFLNRLSDYFFVFSRYVNAKKGKSETLWKPGS